MSEQERDHYTGFLQGDITAQEFMNMQQERIQLEIIEAYKQNTDPVNPNHYRGFSNGAEVIDITENLTGNGAAAVKYLARACRLDGQNKGQIIEDLKKSLWYTRRELSRLQEANDD